MRINHQGLRLVNQVQARTKGKNDDATPASMSITNICPNRGQGVRISAIDSKSLTDLRPIATQMLKDLNTIDMPVINHGKQVTSQYRILFQ